MMEINDLRDMWPFFAGAFLVLTAFQGRMNSRHSHISPLGFMILIIGLLLFSSGFRDFFTELLQQIGK